MRMLEFNYDNRNRVTEWLHLIEEHHLTKINGKPFLWQTINELMQNLRKKFPIF